MSSGKTRLTGLNPAIRPAAEWCLKVADYYGVPVRVISGYRSLETQARLRQNYERCVASGRFPWADGCHYPANRPGESAHNFGLAWDSQTEDPRYMGWWTRVRELAGFKVLPQDPPHAEYPGWRAYV